MQTLQSAEKEVTLIRAAEEKFGDVLDTRTHPNGGSVLLIRRSHPANASVPYMTIRGIISPSGRADFNWGHYDLNEVKGRKSFATR